MELCNPRFFVCLALFNTVYVVVVHFNCRVVSHCAHIPQFISLLFCCWGIWVVSSLALLLHPPAMFKIVIEKDGRISHIFFYEIVRCSCKRRHKRGSGKQSLLYSQVLGTGGTACHTGATWKNTRVVSRQKTGARRVLQPQPLLGSLQQRGDKVNSLGLSSLNNLSGLWALGMGSS